jgi:hypothetical protein
MVEEVGGESDPYGIGMSELQCSFSLLKQSLRTQNNGHCPSLPPPVMLMSRHMPKLYLAADVQLIKVRRLGNSFYDQQA